MAEFVTVMKERNRMCDNFTNCKACPLGVNFDQHVLSGRQWMIDHPEEAEKIIMEWSKENPLITNEMKFKEIFGFDFIEKFPYVITRSAQKWFKEEHKGDDGDG